MTALSKLLQTAIEDWTAQLRASSGALRLAKQGALPRRAVALYLVSLRYLLRGSEQNLALAAVRAQQLGLCDLAEYFQQKTHEEYGHEAWAAADLEQLAPQQELRPCEKIRELVELQRSLIAEHPVLFMVYALWAEYFTVLIGDELLGDLERCGFARAQLSAVTKHVEADVGHAARALEQIEVLWNHGPEPERLLEVVAAAGGIFAAFCDEILAEAQRAA